MQGVPVSKASVIISKKWKKVKASEKKMNKYKLYEEEKQRHEEALQRYQEDHADEMEIINLPKKYNKKARKVSRKASPKSDEPKKVSGPIDDPGEEGQKPKKVSSNGKKTTTKAGKKCLKKYQSHLNLLIQASKKKKKYCLKVIKRKKCLPCRG